MKKKMLRKKMLGLSLALTVCLSSTAGWASGLTTGFLDYSANGESVAGPVPGTTTVSASVSNGGESTSVQLVTALYDDETGALANVAVSDLKNVAAGGTESVTANLNIDTMDGYTVRSFIWDGGSDKMIPVAPVQKNNLALTAKYVGEQTVVTWKELSRDETTASYTVLENGGVLAKNIPADKAAYTIEGARTEMPFYRVMALDANGTVTAVSQAVQAQDVSPVDPSKVQSYSFDPSKMVTESNTTNRMNSRTYGSDDRQVALGGSGTLYYDNEAEAYKYTEELGDGNWGKTEVGGRKAVFTTGFYQKDTTTLKNGCINVLLGDAFGGEQKIRLTFDYYDAGTDSFQIRYVNQHWGSTNPTGTTESITRENSQTWKTATIELSDAWFNNGSLATGLYDGTADFRFESNGKMLYIGKITVERTPFSVAEFVAADDNSAGATISEAKERYTDPQLRMVGNCALSEKLTEQVSDSKGSAWYTYTGTSDAGYRVETIGGKTAVMTAHYNRPNRTDSPYTDGYLYFSLGNGVRSTDKNITITVEYYDNAKEDGATANLDILYHNGNSASSNALKSIVKRTGSNTWKTASIALSDANFNGSEGTGLVWGDGDFRLEGSGDAPLYIHSVKVELTDRINEFKKYEIRSQQPNTQYPDGVRYAVGADAASDTQNGIVLANNDLANAIYDSGDGYIVRETHDGSSAISTVSYGHGGSTGNNTKRNTFLYFTVDDAYLYGIRDSYAELEIEYFDSTDKNMLLHYNTKGNAYTSKLIGTQTKTNTWKTAKVVLNDACFVGTQNFASDFRLAMEGTTSDDQFIIKGISIKNISHKTMKRSEDNIPTVYIAGDSIAANYTSGSIVGWGMRLPNYLTGGAEVKNYATPGASTKTFGNFGTIDDALFKNDYVLISFGHNDSMTEDSRGVDVATYKKNMKAYIAEVLAKQAIPVVISSIPIYYTDGTMNDGVGNYRTAAQEIAAEMNVPFIDLGGEFKNFLSGLDVDTALTYYIDESTESNTRTDRVHLSELGATKVAEIIASGLKKNGQIRVLKNYIQ